MKTVSKNLYFGCKILQEVGVRKRGAFSVFVVKYKKRLLASVASSLICRSKDVAGPRMIFPLISVLFVLPYGITSQGSLK